MNTTVNCIEYARTSFYSLFEYHDGVFEPMLSDMHATLADRIGVCMYKVFEYKSIPRWNIPVWTTWNGPPVSWNTNEARGYIYMHILILYI